MRKVDLVDGWYIQGRITGAGHIDEHNECTLPFQLKDLSTQCSKEGLFLRTWDLTRIIEKPSEPPHSHAERMLLALDGVYGQGEILVDGKTIGPLEPKMELDLSEALRQGACLLTLRFAAHIPVLYPGEYGQDLPVETALFMASIRSIYFLRIEGVENDAEKIYIRIHAYGAGKVRICMRLLKDEILIWSENITVCVQVGSQTITHPISVAENGHGAQLRIVIDRGGEGCDECTVPYLVHQPIIRAYAHFRMLPSVNMLQQIKSAGIHGVVLHTYVHPLLRAACAAIGLELKKEKEPVKVHMLLCAGAEMEPTEECIAVPMTEDDDTSEFWQAQRMTEAAVRTRAAGKTVNLLALSRQEDAQDGLFDATGKPRRALYALRSALGRIAVWSICNQKLYSPCDEFKTEIWLLCDVPDHQTAIIQAKLYLWDGTEILNRSFAVCTRRQAQQAGELCTTLPWACTEGLLLRLQCWMGGKLAAQSHHYYACTDENGKKRAFPRANIQEYVEGGQRIMYNSSNAVAAGVIIKSAEKVYLRYGALLPQERIELAKDVQVMVQYGNPI